MRVTPHVVDDWKGCFGTFAAKNNAHPIPLFWRRFQTISSSFLASVSTFSVVLRLPSACPTRRLHFGQIRGLSSFRFIHTLVAALARVLGHRDFFLTHGV